MGQAHRLSGWRDPQKVDFTMAKKKKTKQETPAPPQAEAAEAVSEVEVDAAEETSTPEELEVLEEIDGETPTEDLEAAAEVEVPEALTMQLLRLQADFENYRKRVLRDKEDLYVRANADLLETLLPVLDHMELAFQSATEDDMANAVVQGVKLVADQLVAVLGKFGLDAVDAEGVEFDPNLHEAISHLPSADVSENFVVAQTRRGYTLGARLLRPAQVVVSSGSPEPAVDA